MEKVSVYIKAICPQCKNPVYPHVELHCIEKTVQSDLDGASRYAVEYIEVKDILTEEAMVRHVLHTIQVYLSDGIEVQELCQILKKYYGIASAYCCDLIQTIKIELDMYSPDHRHLYFVKA
jgi:hypothetical protein